MQDQRISAPAEATEQAILVMLLTTDAQHPWSHDEIVDEIGDRRAATGALASLDRAGLIHRRGDLVLPTRAAMQFDQIAT